MVRKVRCMDWEGKREWLTGLKAWIEIVFFWGGGGGMDSRKDYNLEPQMQEIKVCCPTSKVKLNTASEFRKKNFLALRERAVSLLALTSWPHGPTSCRRPVQRPSSRGSCWTKRKGLLLDISDIDWSIAALTLPRNLWQSSPFWLPGMWHSCSYSSQQSLELYPRKFNF